MGYDGLAGSSSIVNPNDNYWGGGTLLCQLGSTNSTSEAGRYPLHIEPRDNGVGGMGYGQPIFSVLATQNHNLLPFVSQPAGGGGAPVTPKTIGFGVTIRPLITGVSSTTVGMGGGTLLTITGAGFSTLGNNEVYLGGDLNPVPCHVVSSQLNQLTCITGASTVSNTYVKVKKRVKDCIDMPLTFIPLVFFRFLSLLYFHRCSTYFRTMYYILEVLDCSTKYTSYHPQPTLTTMHLTIGCGMNIITTIKLLLVKKPMNQRYLLAFR